MHPGTLAGPSKPRALGAGLLILAVTALFWVVGADRALDALDPERIDRGRVLAGFELGLSPEATQNLTGITAVVILVLCALTTVEGLGVLARRDSVRHAAIGTFIVFTAITVPLTVAGIVSGEPGPDLWVALAVGVTDAVIVYLLVHPETKREFELAEGPRERRRVARASARRARRSARAQGRA